MFVIEKLPQENIIADIFMFENHLHLSSPSMPMGIECLKYPLLAMDYVHVQCSVKESTFIQIDGDDIGRRFSSMKISAIIILLCIVAAGKKFL